MGRGQKIIEASQGFIPGEIIENRIFLIRGKKVMLDRDLAALYGVETKVLNQSVKRKISRFPEDFMFPLTWPEVEVLRSQIVTLKNIKFIRSSRGQHLKYLPYVFTEQGIAMLSSVLNSERAIQVNIQIMRAFTKLRELMIEHKDLRLKIENLEKKFSGEFKKYDHQFQIVFEAIRKLLETPATSKAPIGFHPKK